MATVGGFLHQSLAGEERFWKVWWVGGLGVALLVTVLTFSAEFVRVDGRHAWGDFLDVIKLLVYAAWFVAAWRAAAHTRQPLARAAARLAVAAGVVAAAFTV